MYINQNASVTEYNLKDFQDSIESLIPVIQAQLINSDTTNTVNNEKVDFSALREIIASNANKFFFCNYLTLSVPNLPSGSNMNPEIVVTKSVCSLFPNERLSRYVRNLNGVIPEICIDDLLLASIDFELLDCTGYAKCSNLKSPESYYVSLIWVYELLKCKEFKRSILRHIFNQLVYFDFYKHLTFQIIGLIIDQYSKMDEALTMNSVPFQGSIIYKDDSVNSLQEEEINDLNTDNVYILCSVVWEEIVYVLNNEQLKEVEENKEAVKLLTKIISLTGKFFYRRLVEWKCIFRSITTNTRELFHVLISKMTSLDAFLPEIGEWIIVNNVFISDTNAKNLAKNSPALYLKVSNKHTNTLCTNA